MVLTKARIIRDSDVARFAWAGLGEFRHVPSLAETLTRIHSVPSKHHSNVKKQARQIRQCLMQAREYKDAAAVTTLATRPVLLYYSLMSLSLAQILFKGSGANSLDAARGQHAHHGLDFKLHQLPKDAHEITTAAAALIAEPMMWNGERRGTFELWHRTAREDPITGKVIRRTGVDQTITTGALLFAGSHKRIGELPIKGITLLDCFTGAPGMLDWVGARGVRSGSIRAHMESKVFPNGSSETELIVYSRVPESTQQLQEAIKVRPSDIGRVTVREFSSGFALTLHGEANNPVRISFPPSAMWTADEIRFLPPDTCLNEFGFLYVGLFILSNYARYWPDKWIVDVENATPLAQTTEEFLAMAEWRMALLTLSELSETYLVREV
jgi:hypothetical protein